MLTTYIHPKLTPAITTRFLSLHQSAGKKEASLYLAGALGVWKSQQYLWASRLLAGQAAPAAPTKVSNPVVGNRKVRRLFWDIETSPNVVLSWRIGYKININHDNLLKERAIICIGYKWEGEKEVHVLHWDKDQNDKVMLEQFLLVAADADEMVAHNGDSFDLPWFKTRCLFHGLPTIPDYKTVDTLQWARRKFYFNSNRMDYIAKFLGMGGKIHTEFDLWKDIVLKSCPVAMGKMCAYCKKDVVLLEQVWKRLSQVVPQKTHAGVLAGGEKWTCPRDGSTNVQVTKTKVTANGTVQYQMRCRDCGGYYSIGSRAHDQYLADKRGTSNAHRT